MNTPFFLREKAAEPRPLTMVVSLRITDEADKPIAWQARAIDALADKELRESCRRWVDFPGEEGGAYQLDRAAYQLALTARCTRYPDLADAALQDSYGVMGAEQLLLAMLLPGEYEAYAQEVLTLCGYHNVTNL